jgi:hypothetical protein
MTKLIYLSLAVILLMASSSCSSSGDRKSETPDATTTPEPPKAEDQPKTPKAPEPPFEFSPTRVEVTKLTVQPDTTLYSNSIYIGKFLAYKIFLFDSISGKKYAMEVTDREVLQVYEGSNDIKKAKLTETHAIDSTSNYFLANRLYTLLTTRPLSDFIITIWPRDNDDNCPIQFIKIVKDQNKKVGEVYIHKEPNEILWNGMTEKSLFND